MPEPTDADARLASIVESFMRLADTLVEDYDVIDYLSYLTDRCLALVDVDEAAIMLAAPGGRLQAVAASTERTRLLELFELQNEDGPCLDAYARGVVVIGDDLLAAEQRRRWPRFAPRAADVGFRSVHSVPMRLRSTTVGAINLLRTRPGVLGPVDAALAGALADMATIGLLHHRTVAAVQQEADGLLTALTSRILIEQAKGVVAERKGVSIDDAFEILRRHARSRRRPLSEVADDVVAGRLMP